MRAMWDNGDSYSKVNCSQLKSEMTETNSDEYESYEEISDPYEDISGISTHNNVSIDQEHTKDPQRTLYKRSSADYNDPKA